MHIEFQDDRWKHYYTIHFILKSESGMTEAVELSCCSLPSLQKLWEDGNDRSKFRADFREIVENVSSGAISCDDISNLDYFDEDEIETVYISSVILNERIYDYDFKEDDSEEIARVDFPNPNNEVMF